MTRVYLFALMPGSEDLKCVARYGAHPIHRADITTLRARANSLRARAWWLVACESAAAGRAIIRAMSHGSERFGEARFKHEACVCGLCRCEHVNGYLGGESERGRTTCLRYDWQPGRILDSGTNGGTR